jgi:hypothetical protein
VHYFQSFCLMVFVCVCLRDDEQFDLSLARQKLIDTLDLLEEIKQLEQARSALMAPASGASGQPSAAGAPRPSVMTQRTVTTPVAAAPSS